jgi:signal transduction histidine kinase
MQGQLQLATGGVMLVGFSIAAITNLWIEQHGLVVDLEQEAGGVKQAIVADAQALMLLPTYERDRRLIRLRERHTHWKHTVWLELGDGTMLLPSRSEGSVPPDAVWQLTSRNKSRNPHKVVQTVLDDGTTLLSILENTSVPGLKVGVAVNVTGYSMIVNRYFTLLAVTWGGALLLSLRLISQLVRTIVRPLDKLRNNASTITPQALPSREINVGKAPLEVEELAEAYNALIKRLALSWEQQQDFVRNVSHELRTPLTIISGYLNRLLRRGNNLEQAQRESITIVLDECVRINRLLNDLVDLARSESGQLQISQEIVQPLELIHEVVEQSILSMQRPVLLNTHNNPQAYQLQLLGCRDRLKQVLLNLIENANKYSPVGEPIVLEIHRRGEEVCIDVQDKGDGIAEQDQPHIFERFYRGGNVRNHAGSGLGLPVVKLLVEAMGGRIEVHSSLGIGSTFSLILPIAS